jgi:hypothetical protein
MYLASKQDQVPLMGELPGSYKFLLLGCIFLASFGYVWDGYKQKSTNACLQRLEQGKQSAMAQYGKATSPADKKIAAKYAGYLAQNSDKVCDGL